MFTGRLYAPLLHLRLAEVKGFGELPDAVKALIFPVIRMRPWLGSASYDKAIEKAVEIFPGRPFGYDLDDQALRFLKESPAKEQFRSLFDPQDGFAAYYASVRSVEYAVPVARVVRSLEHDFQAQVQHIAELGRGVILPVELGSDADVLHCANVLANHPVGDWAVYLNAGWDTNILLKAVATVQLANQLLDLKDDLEIVISCSSFPDNFQNVSGSETLPSFERSFFSEVRRQLNRGEVIYGDWASTRPPREATPMTLIPRIDYATPEGWPTWRSSSSSKLTRAAQYQALAQSAYRDLGLNDTPELWSDFMISNTNAGEEPGIKSPATAAAVRINAHLFTEATRDFGGTFNIEDEPVGDDL